MGRRLSIDWEETEQSLQDRYQQATDHQDRTRLQALWLLRKGRSLSGVASVVGKCYETVRRWTEWYRSGGLSEVLSRRHGGSGGREPKLSEEEEQALIEKAREGELRTIWDGVEWARSEADVEYSYWGMRHVFDRLELKKKVPRQQSPRRGPRWAGGMEKRGLSERLEAEGSPESVFFGDEMRLGLIGQVRRRWAPRGVKIRQPVEFTYEWTYLNLAVDPLEGTLKWDWTKWDWTSDMKAESIAPVLESWEDAQGGSQGDSQGGSLEAIVWDGARGHQGEEYDEVNACRIQQPPYPESLRDSSRSSGFSSNCGHESRASSMENSTLRRKR